MWFWKIKMYFYIVIIVYIFIKLESSTTIRFPSYLVNIKAFKRNFIA